ncbi:MAG: cytochrome c-type biogenesis protein [Actinomycetota bacterium]|nr:cytochrome c-type biogenesis protein [Actinomycetota bacterium]
MKRWVPWLALLAVVVVALGVLIARSGPSDSPEARARRLERELACPVCTGEALAESNAPEARAMKTDIRELIADGRSDAEITQIQVGRYGERILLNPEDSGIGLVAWGLPVVVLIGGAAGIVVALRRWSNQPRLTASAADEDVVREAREHDDA